ncbi:MAG: UvrD-helicase domain-containing protein, partial [Candidatus Eremiobacteraeota bacterium]|nr:UvrD-helicase domain-containing protein [Candidatus Eremiobacteraeota bacterium]
MYYTKDSYRDSLNVSTTELQRQYRREVDLAKILEHLYRSYLELQAAGGYLTAGDAIAQASHLLRGNHDIARAERGLFSVLFVDDVQELTVGQLIFLQALCGESLSGATFAGDPVSAMGNFNGARPDRIFSLQATSLELRTQFRCPAAVETAAEHLLGESPVAVCIQPSRHALTLFRGNARRDETHFIRDYVGKLLQSGIPPSEIAIIFRSVRNVQAYEMALLNRNIEIETAGDVNLFNLPDVEDAVALLWSVVNPFRHDQLLRVMSGGTLRLCDATLQLLCSDPPSAQP